MRARQLGVLCFLCLIVLSSKAQASLITANATIDLNSAITGSSWTGVAHPLDSTVSVSSGDTVTINIDFLPGQVLTWNSNGYFSPWLMLDGFPGPITNPSQSGLFSWSGLSVSLLGLTQGTQFPPAQLVGGSSGAIHLGPTFTLGNDSVVRTFTGVTLTFLATWSDGDPFRDFSTIGYYTPIFGGTVSFEQVQAVPEPSTFALLGLGLCGFGGYRFRRRVA